jgi:methane monooxygenase PmoA-like
VFLPHSLVPCALSSILRSVRITILPLIVVGNCVVATEATQPDSVLVVPASPVSLQVSVPLATGQRINPATPGRLVEVDHPEVVCPIQLIPAVTPNGEPDNSNGRLVAAIPPREGATGDRRFALRPASAAADGKNSPVFQIQDIDDKSLGVFDGKQPVFVYNHGVITKASVPESDHRRSRSCYIHPVYGIGGEVLTDDFPRDHYHHHGIFWTWPHVGVDGQEHNTWAGNTIRQEFVKRLDCRAGPVAAVLGIENGWFVGEKKVVIERVWITAHKVAGDTRAMDIQLVFIPTDKPVTLWGAQGKSYGGLTVRFCPPSRKDSATVITVQEGVTDVDLSESPQPWADYTSKLGGHDAPSGASVFIGPDHPDYPPTWLLRHYGPLCVGWPGITAQTFQPGKPIRLNYRIWIHKSAVAAEEVQQAYDGYLTACEVKWGE